MAFWFGIWRDIDREMRELRRRLKKTFEEMSRAFEREMKPIEVRMGMLTDFVRPMVDIYETPEKIVVIAELPGVRKEDIEIDVIDTTLEIKAEVKREEEVAEEAYYRRERYYKGFYRRLKLPVAVDPERAKATYENGVLRIELPKLVAEKKRRIEIE